MTPAVVAPPAWYAEPLGFVLMLGVPLLVAWLWSRRSERREAQVRDFKRRNAARPSRVSDDAAELPQVDLAERLDRGCLSPLPADHCPDCRLPLAEHLSDGACPCGEPWCVRRSGHIGRHLPHPGQTALPVGDEPVPLFGGAA